MASQEAAPIRRDLAADLTRQRKFTVRLTSEQVIEVGEAVVAAVPMTPVGGLLFRGNDAGAELEHKEPKEPYTHRFVITHLVRKRKKPWKSAVHFHLWVAIKPSEEIEGAVDVAVKTTDILWNAGSGPVLMSADEHEAVRGGFTQRLKELDPGLIDHDDEFADKTRYFRA